MTGTFEPPHAPRSIAETGIELGMLQDLALKTLYYEGSVTAETIAERMALPLDPTVGILDTVRKERLCEILGGETASVGGYRYALTNSGFARVMGALERSGYAGPVPVPLAVYVDSVRRQSIHDVIISRASVERCLAGLVLDQQTVDRIGQALSAERAMLLYGDTGNGKTTVAQALRGVLPGHMFIPHAVEVMHQVIQLFDPSTFEVIVPAQSTVAGNLDRRWVKIRRPVVFAAGDLAANQLELVRDEVSQTYEAPIQLKANGGILVIDDFGRQRLDAAYLLNRWIVPLEHRIDHLSLANGARFQVPYDVIPLFISNLRPAELVDEAFLRRIRYKIEIPNPTSEAFNVILRHECERVGVSYNDSAAHYLAEEYFRKAGRTMRGCHPRDIVEAIADAASYRGADPELSAGAIDDACHTYFV